MRERVIAFIEQGGKKVDAAQLFKVSRPAIDKWILLKKETGSLKSPPIPERSWRKIDRDALRDYVNNNPDALLSEYARHFNVSDSGIWRSLKRINYTLKKKRLFTKNVMK